MKRLISTAAMLLTAGQVFAGGQLDTFNFTGRFDVAGLETVDIVPIFWDDRCVNVNYVVDTIPANPGTPQEISPQQIRQELQASFNKWDQIPTSYINMNVAEIRTLKDGVGGFDFVNELTFEAPAGAQFLASSPSVSLQADAEFVTGDDIDGDGDSDVFDPKAAGRNTCFDFDKDGDIEFPAGQWKAGAILDNDVQFNPVVLWSLQPGDDTAADIQAVATHEFGHSHGLSHGLINQISDVDGTQTTMFPFIDTSNAASEVASRSLHTDDIAWSSYIYQEGTALTGPAALQRGDRAFRSQFGLIKGEIKQNGFGVAGASVAAINQRGERVADGFSGVTRAFADADGNLQVLDPAAGEPSSIVNGNYVIPVSLGLYDIAIESLDGSPASSGQISIVAQIGGILGQFFPEEFRGIGPLERSIETQPSLSVPVIAVNGLANGGNNLITNNEVVFRNSGPLDFGGTAAAIGVNDVVYAERFTNAEVLAQMEAGSVITSALFHTEVFDSHLLPKFKRAGLFVGRVNADGTATIASNSAIFARNNFVGQDDDLAPVYPTISVLQNLALRAKLKSDPTLDVFLVLEANNQFDTGTSGTPPLLAVSLTATTPGRSFFSAAGSPLAPFPLAWAIELHFSGVPVSSTKPTPSLIP